MTKNTLTPTKVLSLLLLISTFFSCSKDSDLFAEVVLLDEINTIEDLETNASSQEETDVTIDLENGIFETDEDKIAVFNVISLADIKNGKSPVLKNIVQPLNGQIDVEKDSIIRYLPNADFNGTDYFEVTIEVTDESDVLHEEEVTLEVIVNPISDTVDDVLQVEEITEMGINVLNNDTFKNKNNVNISDISVPSHGTVLLNEDKSIIYTPITLTDTDTFTYTTEVINEDQTVTTEVGMVKLEVASSTSSSTTAKLLFSSGFEGTTTVGPLDYQTSTNGYQYITGTDDDTGYEWNKSLNGLWGSSGNGIHVINTTGQVTNDIETIIGHTGTSTKALHTKIDYKNSVPTTQSPYQINNISSDPDEYYISMWVKFDDLAGLVDGNDWSMCWQYKSDVWYENDGFVLDGIRISIFMVAPKGEKYFRVVVDEGSRSSMMLYNSDTTHSPVTIPTNEWFKLEMYSKVSSSDEVGEYWAKVNGVEIGHYNGRTIGPINDSLGFMMLTQFYGNVVGERWFDDIEIWDGVPY